MICMAIPWWVMVKYASGVGGSVAVGYYMEPDKNEGIVG